MKHFKYTRESIYGDRYSGSRRTLNEGTLRIHIEKQGGKLISIDGVAEMPDCAVWIPNEPLKENPPLQTPKKKGSVKIWMYITVLGSSFVAGLPLTAIIIALWIITAFFVEAIKTNGFLNLQTRSVDCLEMAQLGG